MCKKSELCGGPNIVYLDSGAVCFLCRLVMCGASVQTGWFNNSESGCGV